MSILKSVTKIISGVGGVSPSRIDRISQWVTSEAVWFKNNAHLLPGDTMDDKLTSMAFPLWQYMRDNNVSKSTAWRDYKVMIDCGIVEVKSVELWRPNTKRNWYGFCGMFAMLYLFDGEDF